MTYILGFHDEKYIYILGDQFVTYRMNGCNDSSIYSGAVAERSSKSAIKIFTVGKSIFGVAGKINHPKNIYETYKDRVGQKSLLPDYVDYLELIKESVRSCSPFNDYFELLFGFFDQKPKLYHYNSCTNYWIECYEAKSCGSMPENIASIIREDIPTQCAQLSGSDAIVGVITAAQLVIQNNTNLCLSGIGGTVHGAFVVESRPG